MKVSQKTSKVLDHWFFKHRREDRFQFSISGSPIPKFSIYNFRVKIIVVFIHMDSGVVLFKVYKLWDILDRFDPRGIHTFKMNRSGP